MQSLHWHIYLATTILTTASLPAVKIARASNLGARTIILCYRSHLIGCPLCQPNDRSVFMIRFVSQALYPTDCGKQNYTAHNGCPNTFRHSFSLPRLNHNPSFSGLFRILLTRLAETIHSFDKVAGILISHSQVIKTDVT